MEKFNSPEEKYPKYENLSESQKELLAGQCGINDEEDYEFVISDDFSLKGGEMSAEQVQENLRQILELEQ